jgi:hypothetical protein
MLQVCVHKKFMMLCIIFEEREIEFALQMASKKGGKQVDEPPPPVTVDPSYFICLQSGDGHAFVVDRNCAKISKICKGVIQSLAFPVPPGVEVCMAGNPQMPHVKFTFLTKEQLERAIRFMYFKYRNDSEVMENRSAFDYRNPSELLAISSLLGM